MKNIYNTFLLAIAMAACFMACNKNGKGDQATKPLISLSKTSVNLGEPLFAKANGINNSATVRWSVKPAANIWISSSAGGSVILFSNPGTYTITANYFSDSSVYAPYDSSSSTVTVTDSIYNDSTAHCNSLVDVPIDSGDLVTLTPLPYADTGLVLMAHTQKLYINSPTLDISFPGLNAGAYQYTLNNVVESPCLGTNGPAPATGVLYFGALPNGPHPLIISVNGINYEGTLVVSDTGFSFDWPYSSGVIISPLQINK